VTPERVEFPGDTQEEEQPGADDQDRLAVLF
jgi:hypothetical protein